MSDWTQKLPEAAQEYIAGRRLDEVECLVSDLAGVAKGKAMPASKFGKQKYFHLPNSIFAQTITGDYADMPDESEFTEPDMVLVPDFSTATAVPWTADWTLQVIHDVLDQKGEPVPMAPRNVLKHLVKLYADQGWRPIVAPEMEFYIVARNIDPNQPVIPPIGRSGRRVMANQAYSMSAVDEYGKVIDDIYDFAEAQGLEIDGIVQEGGAGQVELNLSHGDPVVLADEVFYFKRLIREAALRHDSFATFMAKPIEGEPGSAMHIHQSVVDVKTGKNIFADKKGEETPEFMYFVAGMQNYLPAVVALMAPYVNSYRRYVPDFAAPINLEWGRDNRTTGTARPDFRTRGAATGKPPAGDGLQPLSRHGGNHGLRLSRADGKEDAASRKGRQRLYRFRRIADHARRCAGPLFGMPACARGARERILRHLRGGQAERIQGIPAGDQPLGTRASAAERLNADFR